MVSPRRQSWSRPLADLVAATIDPLAAKQGFGESALILNWPDIVGPRFGAHSEPLALQWQRRLDKSGARRSEPATLVLRVESAFALDVQHSTELLIERVNAHLGWRCVGRIVIKQGPLAKATPRARRGAAPTEAALKAAAAACPRIEDEGLREALIRLGARVVG